MPLIKSGSESAFKTNVGTLMNERGISPHVKNAKQALAIAFSEKRRAKRDAGGAVDPVTAVVSALQAGSGQANGGAGSNPGMDTSAPTPASFASAAPAPASSPPQVSAAPTSPTSFASVSPTPANTGIGSGGGLQNAGFGVAPAAQPQTGQQVGGVQTVLNPGGMMNRGGVPHLAFGGPGTGVGQMPWFAKAESRELNHTGPVMSAVPGRTDRHNVSVPSSSYVFPADFVSHLGQNNSQAGMKILGNMGFGSGGPPTGMKMPHGMGAPKPPHMMGIPGDAGGRKGAGHIGTPTPVVIAGGEFVAPPEAIMKVLKTTDMAHAHKTLDRWVLKVRKDHIKTLKGLPPPAKA